jgi:ZIP family zinc transporter
VSFGETVLLGGLAGFTIYLGLPLGRIDFVSKRARVALAMFSVGVLAFLFAEVLVHGIEIVEEHFEELGEDEGSLLESLGLALMLGAGFTAGTAGLALVERRMRGPKQPPIAGGATDGMTVEQAETLTDDLSVRARALHTGMAIAAAIGIHNFAEGLAIGVSASTGEIGLATVLIIGFAVHNATEGM